MDNIRTAINEYILTHNDNIDKKKLTLDSIWYIQKKISDKYNKIRYDLISEIYQIINEKKQLETKSLLEK